MEFIFGLAHRIVVLDQGRFPDFRHPGRGAQRPECSRCTWWLRRWSRRSTRSTNRAATSSAPRRRRRRLWGDSRSRRHHDGRAAHTLTTVIGPNGAGKSTAIKAIFGMVECATAPCGTRATHCGLSQIELLRRGLAYVPQGRNVFPRMSVRANLELGGVTWGAAHLTRKRIENLARACSRCCGRRLPAGQHAERRRPKDARDRPGDAAPATSLADRRAVGGTLADPRIVRSSS